MMRAILKRHVKCTRNPAIKSVKVVKMCFIFCDDMKHSGFCYTFSIRCIIMSDVITPLCLYDVDYLSFVYWSVYKGKGDDLDVKYVET